MSDQDKLEKLKEEKLKQMQGGNSQANMRKQQEEQARQRLKKIASQILTKEARSRLGNIRTARPELASQIEMQLVQLYRSGSIRDKITDEQLKDLLKKVQESKDSTNIKY